MTDQFRDTTKMVPITPPPELVRQWWAQETYDPFGVAVSNLATQAARWGADQELEACCEWVGSISGKYGPRLRLARRPKPPSLAEQATAQLDDAVIRGDCITTTDAMPILRAALKRLKELEGSND